MRHWMRWGCAVVGTMAAACASQGARVSPGPDETPAVASSSGGGGAATAETGRFAEEGDGSESSGAKRALYSQVAHELGLPHAMPGGQGLGGSGISAEEQHLCSAALGSREPVTVVSGIIRFRTSGLVVVDVPGKGPVKLRTDDVTCSVQAGKALPSQGLSEGTEARVAYVEDGGEPTARVIRAEPLRSLR